MQMPTTGGQYGLYGLSEIARPHRFGWWTVVLLVVVGVRVWYFFSKSEKKQTQSHIHQVPSRSEKFRRVESLEGLGNLLVRRSGSYDPAVPLGVTLLGLQTKNGRDTHREFLVRLERTLYDPDYSTMISIDEAKQYLLDATFFDNLTKGG